MFGGHEPSHYATQRRYVRCQCSREQQGLPVQQRLPRGSAPVPTLVVDALDCQCIMIPERIIRPPCTHLLPADTPTTCRILLSGAQGHRVATAVRAGVRVASTAAAAASATAARGIVQAMRHVCERVARQLPEDVRNDEGSGERAPARGYSAPKSAVAEQRPPPMQPRLQRTQKRCPDPSDAHAQHRAPCLLCLSRSQRCSCTGDAFARAPWGISGLELHCRLLPPEG